MLEKPRFHIHIDRVRWLDFFSTTPKEYKLKGGSGPEGLCSREGTDSLVLGVCGCLRGQASSGVGVLSSSMSSPYYHLASPSSSIAQ